jgi:hypothetical protein
MAEILDASDDHLPLAHSRDLLIDVNPVARAGLSVAVHPLHRVELLDLQDVVQMVEFPDAVEVIDRMGEILAVPLQRGQHEPSEHLHPDHVAEVALRDVGWRAT